MGTKERRERERQETRDLILNTAREMFAEHGFEAVTMRAIAERIEYTPTAIYHHFENKQALVTELCQLDFGRLAHHFTSVAETEDPVVRIWQIGEAYLDFAAEHPNHYRFMFMTELSAVEHTQEYLERHCGNPEEDAYAFLRAACAQARDEGRWRAELTDPDEIAQILWATLHGFISLRIVKQHEPWVLWCDARTVTRDTMRMCFRGLLRNPDEVARLEEAARVVPDEAGAPSQGSQ